MTGDGRENRSSCVEPRSLAAAFARLPFITHSTPLQLGGPWKELNCLKPGRVFAVDAPWKILVWREGTACQTAGKRFRSATRSGSTLGQQFAGSCRSKPSPPSKAGSRSCRRGGEPSTASKGDIRRAKAIRCYPPCIVTLAIDVACDDGANPPDRLRGRRFQRVKRLKIMRHVRPDIERNIRATLLLFFGEVTNHVVENLAPAGL